MSSTQASDVEIILEPGDPGYVDPNAAPDLPPPAQDLTPWPEPGETEAEFLARMRRTRFASGSPADIVPNWPHAYMGPEPEPEPEPEPPDPEPEPEPEPDPVP